MAEPGQSSRSGAQGVAGRFVALDGLRGLAAFAVIVDHVKSPMLEQLIPGRYLAVDFFFVLSGFVLANAYQGRFQGGLSVLGFLRARIIRLYPMYVLALGIVVVLVPLMGTYGAAAMSWQHLIVTFGFAVLFLPMPPVLGGDAPMLYPLNPPAWSLSFELLANAVYALTARWLTRRILVAALCVLAAPAFLQIAREETLGAGWMWVDFASGLARVVYGFFAGVLVFKLRDVFQPPPIPAWLAATGLIILLTLHVPEGLRRAFDAAALIVLFPLLVFACQNARISGRLAALASAAGLVSYGVYVLHQPLSKALTWLSAQAGFADLPGIVMVLLVAALSAAISWAADKVYDLPFRRRLQQWLRGR